MAAITFTGNLLCPTFTPSLSPPTPKTRNSHHSIISLSKPYSHSRFNVRLIPKAATFSSFQTFSVFPVTGLPKISPRNPKALTQPTSHKPRSSINPLFKLFTPLLFFFSGGGGGFFNGGGGGGGGGGCGGGDGGSWWWDALCPQALADEETQSEEWDSHGLPADIVVQLNKLSGFKKYKVSDVCFFDRRSGTTTDLEDLFFEMMSLRPGKVYTKAQLEKELEFLAAYGWFEKVDLEGKTNPDGTIGVKISFIETTLGAADKFRCANVGLIPPMKEVEMDPNMTQKETMKYAKNEERDYRGSIKRARPCMLPMSVQNEVLEMLREQGKVGALLAHRVMRKVQKWYHDQGYIAAQAVNFRSLPTKEMVCEVIEGDITQVEVKFQDKLGNVVEGNTKLPVIQRELPKQLRAGHVFNIEAGKQAVRNLSSLKLFSSIGVTPRPDEKKEGGVIVEINLIESDSKSVEVSSKWDVVPGHRGCPTLASIQPGGTVCFEHRNLNGLNRSFTGSVTSSNFLNPQDDLAFRFQYVHPYLDGVNNPHNRVLRASCFNTRKLSPTFIGGPGVHDVPPIWVDRSGVKAVITEDLTEQSKFTYGLVMEEIKTKDEYNHVTAQGQREWPGGGITANGPPTTLSGTGVDKMVFAQANITRDTTRSVNGALVGERNIFQVDQGLGIGIGRSLPFFNRHQLMITKFLQLLQVEEGDGKPAPPVLVLHGRYAGCIGDLPSYDALPLGGPYSVRDYNIGELGAARNVVEVAAELRVPIKKAYVYAFAEHGNDLGSSKDVKGNPTGFYRRKGHGSSYGLGIKLGPLRAEYCPNTGAFNFRYGDRF